MRFAGDFFGVPLVTEQEQRGSILADYFPELRQVKKAAATKDEGARSAGGAKAVSPFTGFKTFESGGPKKAAPVFAGFKAFSQEQKKPQEEKPKEPLK